MKLREAAATLKSSPDEVPARIASLVEERRRLERELADAKKALAMGGGAAKSEDAGPEQVNGHTFLGQVVEGLNPKDLRSTVDTMKQRVGSGIAALIAVNEGRASVAVGVTDDLTGQINAVDLLKAAVETLGGQGGGGRPDMRIFHIIRDLTADTYGGWDKVTNQVVGGGMTGEPKLLVTDQHLCLPNDPVLVDVSSPLLEAEDA